MVLDYGPLALRVTVTDDGRPGASEATGGGHGPVGMRERATAIGGSVTAGPRPGSVTAGPRPGGGFRFVAELPLSLAPSTL
nr:hypothetical protein [Streptomyces sp. SLBN-31]